MLWLRCINIVGFWKGVEEPWREARESAGQRVCQPQLSPGAKGKVGEGVQWPLGQKQVRLAETRWQADHRNLKVLTPTPHPQVLPTTSTPPPYSG